jgi:Sugar (and other) transporter
MTPGQAGEKPATGPGHRLPRPGPARLRHQPRRDYACLVKLPARSHPIAFFQITTRTSAARTCTPTLRGGHPARPSPGRIPARAGQQPGASLTSSFLSRKDISPGSGVAGTDTSAGEKEEGGYRSLVKAISFSLASFVAFRIITGVAVGASSLVVPMYIAEMSPVRIRGGLVILQQLAISAGILISYLLDFAFESAGWGWRPMFAARCSGASTHGKAAGTGPAGAQRGRKRRDLLA